MLRYNKESLLFESKHYLLLTPKNSIVKIYDFNPKMLKQSSGLSSSAESDNPIRRQCMIRVTAEPEIIWRIGARDEI